MRADSTFGITGLSTQEVLRSRSRNGRNEIKKAGHHFLDEFKELASDPMLILLLAAAGIYFIGKQYGDGLFMAAAIVIVSGISIYQKSRSRNALAALANLNQPKSRVIRNNHVDVIDREDIVVGDYVIVEEGVSVPADGVIVHSHDFSLNESILTGESLSVSKQKDDKDNRVYQGTTVMGGLAVCRITEVGAETRLGKIGRSLESVEKGVSPLQIQIKLFVRRMAIAGIVVFLVVLTINFLESDSFLTSLLKSLTLAMSILPEEIPVAFAVFMALGAWRLAQQGVIVRHVTTVETLGSANVICTDKTGTITENRMALRKVFNLATNSIVDLGQLQPGDYPLIEFAMWASETSPFDPMEKSIHEAYEKYITDRRGDFKMVHEYPLSGKPPMMTHIFESSDRVRIIAAKGAPEAFMKRSHLSEQELRLFTEALNQLSREGYRVLAVAQSEFEGGNFPEDQSQLSMKVLGLVAFYDPPKENIKEVLGSFRDAGIEVKIITGDNPQTTLNIARQIGLDGSQTMNGDELIGLSDEELRIKTRTVNIYTRMFPEAKLRILNALKSDGKVVAMTGDGVNDAPALKAAHIGIAMGKKGSETAKEVSSLVLTNDDLAGMVTAVAMGRKIYANLKKAIQYIISIHIPIILTVFVPLVFGWTYPAIFSPIHVIFLELIMGPTCSIIYENEPMDPQVMKMKPRPLTSTFFSAKELMTSVVQGLGIAIGVLLIYQYADLHDWIEETTRTMVFLTLVSANIFLTLVNRSFEHSVFSTLKLKNRLITFVILATIAATTLLLVIPSIRVFFQFQALDYSQILLSTGIGCASVMWYELVKLFRRGASNPVNYMAV